MILKRFRRNIVVTEKKKTKKRKQKKSKESYQYSKYCRSLGKWLKVIFWKYEELQAEIKANKERIDELEKTVKLISEELENMSKEQA